MFDLDLKSRLPIYEQLVEKLKQLMVSNVLKPNEQLPSVRQLATQLTINPNTIQKAYRELENQGFIYSLPGKGSFVSPMNIEENAHKLNKITGQLETLLAEALFLGMTKEQLLKLLQSIEQKTKGGQSHASD